MGFSGLEPVIAHPDGWVVKAAEVIEVTTSGIGLTFSSKCGNLLVVTDNTLVARNCKRLEIATLVK